MTINDLIKSKNIKNNIQISLIARIKFNRANKKIAFLIVNDGTNINDVQVVCKNNILNNYDEIINLRISSVIKIEGDIKNSLNSQQQFEILASKIIILSIANSNYPLQKKEHTNEFLREIAHLRPRTKLYNSIFKIRSVAQYACHDFFYKNNFVNVHSPIITSNDAEGAGESFIVTTIENNKYKNDFFGKKASLTVSGQLNAEAYAQAFQRVYTFAPAFRAEHSNTTRHVAEFWMIEPEIAFIDINEVLNISTKFIKYVVNFILKKCSDEISFLNNFTPDLLKKLNQTVNVSFETITYTEAIELLQEALNNKIKFQNNKIIWGMDLQTEHEKYLCENLYNKPLYIINYPKDIKAFYMKQNGDQKTVAGFDLLVPGIGELVGGSERESDDKKIIKICKNKNIDYSNLQWYLDLRRYGFYKSAGFGLGFERLIMYLTGMNNIRDVIPFPRTAKNLQF